MYLLRDTLVGHALPELVRPRQTPSLMWFCACFLSLFLPQLTFLGTMVSEDIAHVALLQELQPLMEVLHSLFSKFPRLSLQLGAKELKGEEETVLGVWVRESQHNYENNLRINEVSSGCWQKTLQNFMTHLNIV